MAFIIAEGEIQVKVDPKKQLPGELKKIEQQFQKSTKNMSKAIDNINFAGLILKAKASLSTIEGGFLLVSAAVLLSKGDLAGMRLTLEQLPAGIGPVIRAFNQMRDAMSGAAEEAKRLETRTKGLSGLQDFIKQIALQSGIRGGALLDLQGQLAGLNDPTGVARSQFGTLAARKRLQAFKDAGVAEFDKKIADARKLVNEADLKVFTQGKKFGLPDSLPGEDIFQSKEAIKFLRIMRDKQSFLENEKRIREALITLGDKEVSQLREQEKERSKTENKRQARESSFGLMKKQLAEFRRIFNLAEQKRVERTIDAQGFGFEAEILRLQGKPEEARKAGIEQRRISRLVSANQQLESRSALVREQARAGEITLFGPKGMFQRLGKLGDAVKEAAEKINQIAKLELGQIAEKTKERIFGPSGFNRVPTGIERFSGFGGNAELKLGFERNRILLDIKRAVEKAAKAGQIARIGA